MPTRKRAETPGPLAPQGHQYHAVAFPSSCRSRMSISGVGGRAVTETLTPLFVGAQFLQPGDQVDVFPAAFCGFVAAAGLRHPVAVIEVAQQLSQQGIDRCRFAARPIAGPAMLKILAGATVADAFSVRPAPVRRSPEQRTPALGRVMQPGSPGCWCRSRVAGIDDAQECAVVVGLTIRRRCEPSHLDFTAREERGAAALMTLGCAAPFRTPWPGDLPRWDRKAAVKGVLMKALLAISRTCVQPRRPRRGN